MRFDSEIIKYPNYQDYTVQIFNSIVDLLNGEDGSIGSIFIGNPYNNNINLSVLQTWQKNIESLLESGIIYPKPNSVQILIISKFLEIEVEPSLEKSFIVTPEHHST